MNWIKNEIEYQVAYEMLTGRGSLASGDHVLTPGERARVQAARVAFRKMRALVLGGRATQHMKGVYRRCFEALVLSVMLYGAEVWALSPAQLERLEVALPRRSMLRAALPPRMRWRRGDKGALSSVALRQFYGLQSVATFLVRKQCR